MHYFLTATHNNAEHLPGMVHSIREQFSSDLALEKEARILILDDASTDSTPQVLESLKKLYPGLDFIRHAKNQGVSASRNDLLDWICSSLTFDRDFVTFVDGDDLLLRTTLANRRTVFEARPEVDVVGGQLELFYSDGYASHCVLTFPTDPEIQRCANLFECHFYGANATYRARVFKSRERRFPQVNRCEDWLFFAAHPQLNLQHIPEVTLRYRRHSANLTITGHEEASLFEARYAARVLGLMPFGLVPSRRDVAIMDAVGYLTFNTMWKGGVGFPDDTHLPVFKPLSSRSIATQDPNVFFSELRHFAGRLSQANARTTIVNPHKMDLFLAALIARAEEALPCPV